MQMNSILAECGVSDTSRISITTTLEESMMLKRTILRFNWRQYIFIDFFSLAHLFTFLNVQ